MLWLSIEINDYSQAWKQSSGASLWNFKIFIFGRMIIIQYFFFPKEHLNASSFKKEEHIRSLRNEGSINTWWLTFFLNKMYARIVYHMSLSATDGRRICRSLRVGKRNFKGTRAVETDLSVMQNCSNGTMSWFNLRDFFLLSYIK